MNNVQQNHYTFVTNALLFGYKCEFSAFRPAFFPAKNGSFLPHRTLGAPRRPAKKLLSILSFAEPLNSLIFNMYNKKSQYLFKTVAKVNPVV
ncbi:MAG: hypothetical protein ACK5L3_13015 [Oscillospiraceae bacterium]